LYKTDDCSALANGLKTLLSDPIKENQIRINAKNYFNEHFNFQVIVREYIKIITS
jgi:glycosyltransferase involved in cell wall biosynthesis